MIHQKEMLKMKPTVLLTPGPLTTSAAVKQAMLQDLGTRDDEYRMIIQSLREQLCELGVLELERVQALKDSYVRLRYKVIS